MRRVHVIDSHTGGEPTRVIVAGGPDLGEGDLAARRERFRTQADRYRRAVVNEPRGSDVLVGALLVPPADPACCAGVIFFNNVGYLGMCGHGTIGVAVTLGYLGRIAAGRHKLDTPVGAVEFEYDGGHGARLDNVPSYRWRADVEVDVEGLGTVVGDIAWGGNWFFLAKNVHEDLRVARAARLTDVTLRIRAALERIRITGADGAEIDHIELYGPPGDPRHDSRNFVLCPGGAYDRSPCGTGTSAKVACLAADGKLAPGAIWRQESVLGSVFEASYRRDGERIIPSIRGEAYVTSDSQLLIDDADPLAWGIGS